MRFQCSGLKLGQRPQRSHAGIVGPQIRVWVILVRVWRRPHELNDRVRVSRECGVIEPTERLHRSLAHTRCHVAEPPDDGLRVLRECGGLERAECHHCSTAHLRVCLGEPLDDHPAVLRRPNAVDLPAAGELDEHGHQPAPRHAAKCRDHRFRPCRIYRIAERRAHRRRPADGTILALAQQMLEHLHDEHVRKGEQN